MNIHLTIKLITGGLDSYIANFETVPRPGNHISLHHRKKVIQMVCTSVSDDKIYTEEVDVERYVMWDETEVIHAHSI